MPKSQVLVKDRLSPTSLRLPPVHARNGAFEIERRRSGRDVGERGPRPSDQQRADFAVRVTQSKAIAVAEEVAFNVDLDGTLIGRPAGVEAQPRLPGMEPRVRAMGRADRYLGRDERVRRVDRIEVVDEVGLDEAAELHRHVSAEDDKPALEIGRRVQVHPDAEIARLAQKLARESCRVIDSGVRIDLAGFKYGLQKRGQLDLCCYAWKTFHDRPNRLVAGGSELIDFGVDLIDSG